MASEKEIERIARQLCIAAGITALTFVLPHHGNGCSFGPFDLWHPVTSAPERMEDCPYIVSDGSEKVGWYRLGGGEVMPLEPQPMHWLAEEDLLRLIPAHKA